MYTLYELEAFVAQAISGDIFAQAGGGFVSVMAKSSPAIQKDIPAAFEMYTLLEHYLKSLPVRHAAIGYGAKMLDLEPGIVVDDDGRKVIALLPIQANQLAQVALSTGEQPAARADHAGLPLPDGPGQQGHQRPGAQRTVALRRRPGPSATGQWSPARPVGTAPAADSAPETGTCSRSSCRSHDAAGSAAPVVGCCPPACR